jgi:hypothetical protein
VLVLVGAVGCSSGSGGGEGISAVECDVYRSDGTTIPTTVNCGFPTTVPTPAGLLAGTQESLTYGGQTCDATHVPTQGCPSGSKCNVVLTFDGGGGGTEIGICP